MLVAVPLAAEAQAPTKVPRIGYLERRRLGARILEDVDRARSGRRRAPSARFFIERKRIVELAAKHQIPAMYQAREFVELGGLVAYGASIPDLFRRKAVRALGRTIP